MIYTDPCFYADPCTTALIVRGTGQLVHICMQIKTINMRIREKTLFMRIRIDSHTQNFDHDCIPVRIRVNKDIYADPHI